MKRIIFCLIISLFLVSPVFVLAADTDRGCCTRVYSDRNDGSKLTQFVSMIERSKCVVADSDYLAYNAVRSEFDVNGVIRVVDAEKTQKCVRPFDIGCCQKTWISVSSTKKIVKSATAVVTTENLCPRLVEEKDRNTLLFLNQQFYWGDTKDSATGSCSQAPYYAIGDIIGTVEKNPAGCCSYYSGIDKLSILKNSEQDCKTFVSGNAGYLYAGFFPNMVPDGTGNCEQQVSNVDSGDASAVLPSNSSYTSPATTSKTGDSQSTFNAPEFTISTDDIKSSGTSVAGGNFPTSVTGGNLPTSVTGGNFGSSFNLSTYPNPINTIDVRVVVGRIVKAILAIVGALALIMFVYGGFMWLTAAGNEQKIETGRNTLIWSSLGLIIVFSAYVIVKYVMEAVGAIDTFS